MPVMSTSSSGDDSRMFERGNQALAAGEDARALTLALQQVECLGQCARPGVGE